MSLYLYLFFTSSPSLSTSPSTRLPVLAPRTGGLPPAAILSGLRHRYYFLPSGALVIALGVGALGTYLELLRGPFGEDTESGVVYTRVYCSVHVGIQQCTRVYTFPL